MLSKQEILNRKVSGDYTSASKILGITPDNVRQSLNRPESKNHKAVCKALSKIISNREKFIESL